jgi:hypothetical protein
MGKISCFFDEKRNVFALHVNFAEKYKKTKNYDGKCLEIM